MSAPIDFRIKLCYNNNMNTGISTACIFNRCETEDSFAILKQLGVQSCELFLQTFYEYRPDFAGKYASRAEGLMVDSVHVMSLHFESQLLWQSLRQRGDSYYWLEQVMRSAQIFGVKNYTFHGIVRKQGEGNDDFDRLGERLREAVAFCAKYGVRLCLENVRWSLYNRPSVFSELKRRCPDLSGTFDIKQARLSGYPYAMFIEDMKGAISQVHLSDVDENGRTCLPGKGVYNFTEIFKRLKDAGFNGNVFIEDINFGELSELKQSLDFINEIVYKIN